ncbi:MAG: diguanylate cyclase domain-containing protein [Acidiferrobacterales bacterium]
MNDRHDERTIRGAREVSIQPAADIPQKPCLTLLQGGPVGMVHTLPAGAATLIGRGDDADLRLEGQSVSRKHAQVSVTSQGQVIIADLGSSNGTFVNGVQVHRQELKDGDQVQVGHTCTIKFSYQDDPEYQLQHDLAIGIKDVLTNLYTKKYFEDRVDTEVAHARRHDERLGVLVFEVDHYKSICRDYGELMGETVLKEVAGAVNQILRAGDVFVRLHTERFAVLARDIGDDGAAILAQRIRKSVKSANIESDGATTAVTVSIGIATLSENIKKPAKFIRAAEKALAKIKKKEGEDCIGGETVDAFLEDSDSVPTLYYVSNKRA